MTADSNFSGDSWSDINFDLAGPYPSPESPFGNPIYPKLNASYGALWPVYLTQRYNNSLIQTYGLAKDCSVVDNAIDPTRLDLITQVQQFFVPLWGRRNSSSWQPGNTLFVILIGVNDVNIALNLVANISDTFDKLMFIYSGLVDQVSHCIFPFRNNAEESQAIPNRSKELPFHEFTAAGSSTPTATEYRIGRPGLEHASQRHRKQFQ